MSNQFSRRLTEQTRRYLREWQLGLSTLHSRLRLLGPEQVLSRGYSITMDAKTGRIMRRSREAKRGQSLRTRLAEGEIQSVVDGGQG